MGIQSTTRISREIAIDRIKEIDKHARENDYRIIEQMTTEDDYDVASFVNNYSNPNLDNIEKWTSKMIEDLLESAFFRWSMFDNYIVED